MSEPQYIKDCTFWETERVIKFDILSEKHDRLNASAICFHKTKNIRLRGYLLFFLDWDFIKVFILFSSHQQQVKKNTK